MGGLREEKQKGRERKLARVEGERLPKARMLD